jgi:hypothetical protein
MHRHDVAHGSTRSLAAHRDRIDTARVVVARAVVQGPFGNNT